MFFILKAVFTLQQYSRYRTLIRSQVFPLYNITQLQPHKTSASSIVIMLYYCFVPTFWYRWLNE